MVVKSRRKPRTALRRTTGFSESSSSETHSSLNQGNVMLYYESNDNVVRWGYIVILLSWIIFVGGTGGILGIWDHVFELQDNQIVDLACYFSLIVVTGFIWTVLNWVGLKSFRMTSSKV